jgi:hypothetical protein
MRALIVVVLAVAIIAAVLKHRNGAEPDTPTQQPTPAQQQTSAAREPSQHNWPKRSLDRAADVKRQVAEQRKEDGTR